MRFGFIARFGCSTWLLAKLTSRYYGKWAGFLAALALNLTGYYGLAAATFALPDGPLLFFWLLTIDRLTVALDDPDRQSLKPWVWVGLAWGGALLSKYHAVLIPLGTAVALCLIVLCDAEFTSPVLILPWQSACSYSARSSRGTPAMAGRRFSSREAAGRELVTSARLT